MDAHQVSTLEAEELAGQVTPITYALLLSHYLSENDLVEASLLYTRMPPQVKGDADILVLWSITRLLHDRDFVSVYQTLEAHPWNDQLRPIIDRTRMELRERMFAVAARAYSKVRAASLAQLVGMPMDAVKVEALRRGWTTDSNDLDMLVSPEVNSHAEKLQVTPGGDRSQPSRSSRSDEQMNQLASHISFLENC